MLRNGLVVLILTLLVGCVQTGDVQPMRTEQGRQEARQAYIDLAVGYLQEGMTSKAKVPLQNVLKMNPRDAEALEVMAVVFQQEMESELAEEYFKKALAVRKTPRILNNYGGFLFEQERYSEALEVFTEASADNMYGNRARVFENMGKTAEKLNDTENAYRYYQRASRLDPRLPETLLRLGVLSYAQQDYVAAQSYYEAYLTMGEQNAASLLLGARLAKVFDDRDLAASLGLQLRRIYPASDEYKAYMSER